jgi:peptide/nickel transport system ATP-binding protein
MTGPVLEVAGLTCSFAVAAAASFWRRRQRFVVVDNVSFVIPAGQTYALVGESGSGKSTIAKAVAGLQRSDSGTIRLRDKLLDGRRSRRRAGIQMVFQDPYSSLNPRWRVGSMIAEALRHGGSGALVADMLRMVALDPDDAGKYPHQFSGGQRQRIAIARALAAGPDLLICDEPTSALDVSVQAQIINLLLDLQSRLGLSYLFISHNLAVVRQVADVVGVMQAGRLVEAGPASQVLDAPLHAYTRALLDAAPTI